jgi:4-hydroxy-4-methyl-2-oxoglutarate aldolase
MHAFVKLMIKERGLSMTAPQHTQKELDAIRKFTVPTLANAIETFGVIPSNQGYCDDRMHCRFPNMPLMLGYAVTARVSTDQPPSQVRPGISEPEYWRWIAEQPGPKVCVLQDIDTPPKGAMWGEWNANVHKAVGCVGMVTEGACRDLDAVQKLGFHFFSTAILPSHGYGAFIDYSGSVRVAGLVVSPGDLLAGDMHGVILIPLEIPLLELAQAAERIDKLESEVFALCQSPDFCVEKMAELDASVAARWPTPTGKDERLLKTA